MQAVADRVAAGRVDDDLAECAQQLVTYADDPAQACRAGELQAMVMLQRGRIDEARGALSTLLAGAPADRKARLTALVAILAENPDGKYAPADGGSPADRLVADATSEGSAPAGSLTQPETLRAALRRKARPAIAEGAGLLDRARKLAPTDPAAAEEAYVAAQEAFRRADSLVEGIARSYRLEVASRRIALRRRSVDRRASEFDERLAQLGRREMSREQYAAYLTGLIADLQAVQDDLDAIGELTQTFPAELMVESRTAELDGMNVAEMLTTLKQELNASR
jgi:hypothetical protein